MAAAGLKLKVSDEAILKAIEITYPKWVLGVVGAAGFATSSTASAIILRTSCLG